MKARKLLQKMNEAKPTRFDAQSSFAHLGRTHPNYGIGARRLPNAPVATGFDIPRGWVETRKPKLGDFYFDYVDDKWVPVGQDDVDVPEADLYITRRQ